VVSDLTNGRNTSVSILFVMSVDVWREVWKSFPHGGSKLLVLLALADYASDDGGNIRPSIATLARKCRLSAVQTRRVVHELIELGAILVKENHYGGAPGKSRHYRINLTALAGDSGTALISDSPYIVERAITGESRPLSPVNGTALAHESQITINHQRTVNTLPECLSPNGSATHARSEAKVQRKLRVPYQQILDAYHTHFPSGPRVSGQADDLSKKRKAQIAARWQEVLNGRYHLAEETKRSRDLDKALIFFRRYFDFCEQLDWCTGRRPMNGSGVPWVAKIDNLMGAEFMAKRIDEAFDGRETFRL
jgi:Helix-turn-helix domain